MIKDVNGYLLTRNIGHKYIVKVRPFTGAKVSCLHDHTKPIIREFNPEYMILHVGTNDLNTEKTSSEIANSIIDQANSLKTSANNIIISLIAPRRDTLNNKASEVNDRLKHMCDGRNYRYIDHNDSIDVANHIGVSNLHLNRTGTVVLAKDFGNFLMNMD